MPARRWAPNTSGKRVGGFGTGCFSLYATKNIMSAEGGMITTDDEALAQKCRMLRNHGMQRRYYHDMLGYNFRMTDLNAAIGLAQIERLEAFTASRQANAAYLNEHIHSVVTPQVRGGLPARVAPVHHPGGWRARPRRGGEAAQRGRGGHGHLLPGAGLPPGAPGGAWATASCACR